MTLLRVNFTGDSGKNTATAGTPIRVLVPPRKGSKTRIMSVRYVTAANAHIMTVMRPLARTTVLAAAAAGATVVTLKIDPGTLMAPARPLAVNDWVVLEGVTPATGYYVFVLAQVSAVAAGTVAGSLNVTLTAALPAGGVLANAVCWMMGLITDGHPQFDMPASATNLVNNDAVGIFGARGRYEPLVLWFDNVTAAGILENAVYAYTDESQSGAGGSSGLMPQGGEGAAAAEAMEPDEQGDIHLVPAYAIPQEDEQAVLSELHNTDPAWIHARPDQNFQPLHLGMGRILSDPFAQGEAQGQEGQFRPPEYAPGAGFAPGVQLFKDPQTDEEVKKWVQKVYGDQWPGEGGEGGYDMPPAEDNGGESQEGDEGGQERRPAELPGRLQQQDR